MRARKITKRIEIWQTVEIADGFGGNKKYNQQITTTWAEVKTLNNKFNVRLTDFGISETQMAISVKVRLRSDFTYNSINQFIVYRGESYTINTFPTNTNYDNSYIEFIAVKEAVKSVPVLLPIGAELIAAGYQATVEAFGGVLSSEGCTLAYVNKLLKDNEPVLTGIPLIVQTYKQFVVTNGGSLSSDVCTTLFVTRLNT